MPSYQYQATQSDGSQTQGLVFAGSIGSAMQDLEKRGLQVQSISAAAQSADPLAQRLNNLGPDPTLYTASNGQANQAPANDPLNGPINDPVSDQGSDPVQIYAQGGSGIPGVYAPDVRVAASKEIPGGANRGGVSYGEALGDQRNMIEGPNTAQRSYMATSVAGPLVGKVPLANLSFFFSQLSTMLDAGVPMVQALDTLSKQQRHPKFKAVITEIRGHVEAGRPMTAGMQRYPEVFTPVMLSVVRAGEEGGFLDSALKTTAEYVEQEIELRNLYRRVTFYPKLQVVLSMLIIIAANAIINSIRPGSRGLSSPLTTLSTWYWLGPLLIVIFLFARVGLANFRVKYAWDLFISNVPYIGATMRQIAMARFGRAFGALYRSGVPMNRALILGADACGNEYLRSRMYPAERFLEQGAGVTETLKATNAFSPIVIDMLNTGEKTGNLDQMLGKMADFYEGESKTRSVQLGYVFGAIVGLGVAIYIGFIVISFWQGYGDDFQKTTNELDSYSGGQATPPPNLPGGETP